MNGLAQVYGDWIRRYKVDGFRIDTARHVDRAFFKVWTPKILAAARAAGVPDFELFGEVFIADAIELVDVRARARAAERARLPVPGRGHAVTPRATRARRGSSPGSTTTTTSRAPSGVAHTPPTFLGNHDMGRAARMIKDRSGGKSGAELLRRVQLGHTLMYLLRGAPVVYYGDEVGIVGARRRQGGAAGPLPDAGARAGGPRSASARAPIGAGSSFDVAAHPVARPPEAARLRCATRIPRSRPARRSSGTRRAASLAVSRIDAADAARVRRRVQRRDGAG